MWRNPLRAVAPSPWDGLLGRLVLVNLKSGSGLRGVLWEILSFPSGERHVVMRDCSVIAGEQHTAPADEIRFNERELDFFQVLT